MAEAHYVGLEGLSVRVDEKLQVTTCSNSKGWEVGVDPMPTKAERTDAAEADVALEQEQHFWHVTP